MYKLDNNVEWTEELKNAFKTGTTRAKIIYDGDKEINETNCLKQLELKDTQYVPGLGIIGQAVSKELSFSFVNKEGINLENQEITLKIGAEYNGDVYYITYGNFIVYEAPKNDNTNEVTSVVANDYMKKFDILYEDSTTYPCTLRELTEDICQKVGVELGSESFTNEDFIVVDNQFEGKTAREVIQNVAKSAFSWARIGQDNKLYFDFESSEEIEIVGSHLVITGINTTQPSLITEIKAPDNSTTVEGTSLTITDADETKKARVTEIKGSGQRPILPEEYQEVEYIESTGTQHIDSNYTPNYNTKIYCKFAHNEGVIDTPVFGCRGVNNASQFVLWSHPTEFGRNGTILFNSRTYTSQNYVVGTVLEFEYSKTGGTYGQQTWTWSPTEGSPNVNLIIFGLRNNTSIDSRKFSGKMWAFKIWEIDILVRDMIPCYRKIDNVIGMYDVVNDIFYVNEGTGDFTKGEDVSYEGVSGDNNIVVSNKNLFDSNKAQIGKAWNNTSNTARAIVIIKVEPNTKYTISFQSITGLELWWFGRANENDSTRTDGNYQITTSPTTIITNATTNYLGLQFNKTSIAQSDIDNCNIQLEKGTTATSYIAHQGNTYRVDLGGKNLLNVEDTIRNFNNNNFVVKTYNNCCFSFEGTTTSAYYNTNALSYYLPKGTYTISSTNNNYKYYFWIRDITNTVTYANVHLNNGTATFTINENAEKIVIGVEGLTSGETYNLTETCFQIEKRKCSNGIQSIFDRK